MPRTLLAALVAVPCMVMLLPALAVAIILFLFAASVRAIGRILEPSFMTWTELIEFDRVLGWRPRPNINGHYLAQGDDVFRLVTDGEGWPGRRSLDESHVVVIGDSFAFGYGVAGDRSFAALDPRLGVKGIGAPGYSMVHGVLLMEEFGRRLRGKLVVWFVYPENDLQDNLAPEMRGYRAPFVRPDRTDGGWAIVGHHIAAAKWACSNLDARRLYPRFCVPGPLADRAYAACEYLIERARSACTAADAQLVVVTIPNAMQLTARGRAGIAAASGDPARCDADLPDRRIAAACRRHAVPCITAKDYLTHGDYKRREGIHWTRRGHRRMAALLAEIASFRSGAVRDVPYALPQTVPHE